MPEPGEQLDVLEPLDGDDAVARQVQHCHSSYHRCTATGTSPQRFVIVLRDLVDCSQRFSWLLSDIQLIGLRDLVV